MFRSKAKIPTMIKVIQTITNIKKLQNTKSISVKSDANNNKYEKYKIMPIQ